MTAPNGIPSTVTTAGSGGSISQSQDFTSVLQQLINNSTSASTTSAYDAFGFSQKEAGTTVLLGSDQSTVGKDILPKTYVPGQTAAGDVKMGTVETLAQQIAAMANSSDKNQQQAWQQTQAELALIGAYGSTGKYTPGAWTKNDITAVHDAVQGYLSAGQSNAQSFSEYIDQQAQAAIAANKQSPNGTGFKATSPQDIISQGNNAAQAELGRSLNAAEQNSLISEVQGQQQAAFNQGDIYLRSITPAAVAQQFVVDNNLPEYTQHQVESYLNTFANMFKTSATPQVNMNPGDVAVAVTPGG